MHVSIYLVKLVLTSLFLISNCVLIQAVADAVGEPHKLVVVIINGRPATFGPKNEVLTKATQ